MIILRRDPFNRDRFCIQSKVFAGGSWWYEDILFNLSFPAARRELASIYADVFGGERRRARRQSRSWWERTTMPEYSRRKPSFGRGR